MSYTKSEIERLRKANEPSFGWVNDGNGWYSAPCDFEQSYSFITPEFSKFAEKMQARWSLFEYFKVWLKQNFYPNRDKKD